MPHPIDAQTLQPIHSYISDGLLPLLGKVVANAGFLELQLASGIWTMVDHSDHQVGMKITAKQTMGQLIPEFGKQLEKVVQRAVGSPYEKEGQGHMAFWKALAPELLDITESRNQLIHCHWAQDLALRVGKDAAQLPKWQTLSISESVLCDLRDRFANATARMLEFNPYVWGFQTRMSQNGQVHPFPF